MPDPARPSSPGSPATAPCYRMPRERPSWPVSCLGWPGRRRERPLARSAPGRPAPGPAIACAWLPRRPAALLLSMPSQPAAVARVRCRQRAGGPSRVSAARALGNVGADGPPRSECRRSGSPRGLNLQRRTRGRERGGAKQEVGGAGGRRVGETSGGRRSAARASGRTPAGSTPTGCFFESGRQG